MAKLMNASANKIREVISMSSTLGLATSRQTMLQGGTVRNSFAGISGQMGVLVWDMVESDLLVKSMGFPASGGRFPDRLEAGRND